MFCVSTREGVREVPYLPDELLLNCLARVPRSYYPSLSLVSKRFRSLLTSKELYKTRKLLGTTESCLHVVLDSKFSSLGSWFALCQRPTRTILSCYCRSWKNLLVSIPTHKLSPPPQETWQPRWTHKVVGSDIYMIGGYINGKPSPRVFVLDCLSHTCHEAPSMRVARRYPLVTLIDKTIYVREESSDGDAKQVIEVFDTKTKIWETLPSMRVAHKYPLMVAIDKTIYVMEGYPNEDSHRVIEFFDPKTKIWDSLPSPGAEIRITKISAINGKLYLSGDKNVVYKPKEKKWDAVGPEVWLPRGDCVVDNVPYCYFERQLKWWDSMGLSLSGSRGTWRELKGCESLRNLVDKWSFSSGRLVNYGGKIAVFWEKSVFATQKKKIWFAEVTLEKGNNGQEIRGKVSHRGVVLTVPKSSSCKSSFIKHLIVSTV